MHRQKIVFFYCLIIGAALIFGCSSSRKNGSDGKIDGQSKTGSYSYGELAEANLTSEGVFIKKLQLNLRLEGKEDSYTANLRRSGDGKWLATIQLLRVEVLRVYADRLRVIVLDRIGRKAYNFTWTELTLKYGLSYDILPALLGDMPVLKEPEGVFIPCDATAEFNYEGNIMRVSADCDYPRAKELYFKNVASGREIYVSAEKFKKAGPGYYSSIINMSEKSEAIALRINIDEVVVPWAGAIQFEIPQNYKIER